MGRIQVKKRSHERHFAFQSQKSNQGQKVSHISVDPKIIQDDAGQFQREALVKCQKVQSCHDFFIVVILIQDGVLQENVWHELWV